ncbi:macrophage migration inhibitory factor-like [Mytilus californianus]|uniref:macrophage migration inhibitory factor-like n=1 Tax=Mytilus californianus TaxID=6549 RepID=UPI002245580A|nr:macrophage migration inhibitory factor-like [Mytilus californianus]XP_052064908.1 macrophage migration inhibitory factor-like [Mytilus californianus]
MPRIFIHTNLKDSDLQDDFEDKVAQKISEVLEYPLELVYINVSTGNRMINNGRKTPMMFLDIESANRFNEKVNDDYTKVFIPFFASLLSMPTNRIVVKYYDANIADFGVVRQAPEFKHAEYYLALKE